LQTLQAHEARAIPPRASIVGFGKPQAGLSKTIGRPPTGISLIALLTLFFLISATAPAQTTSSTLFLRFGVGVAEDQRWDGSIDVVGGEIEGVEGWQFSEGDSITGSNSWRLTNRRDEVA